MGSSDNSTQQSWWKRHCTPPPAINRMPMCPCRDCFDAAPQRYDDDSSESYGQPITSSSSPSSTPSSATSSATPSRKNSMQISQADTKDPDLHLRQRASRNVALAHVENVDEKKNGME